MLTTYSHPGGPEGYVWKNPARFQEPGWGRELGQVLRAVSPTAQGTIGRQLRGVAGLSKIPKKDENGSQEIFENRPVADGGSRFLLPVVLCGLGPVFALNSYESGFRMRVSSRQKRLRWSRNTVFGSFWEKRLCRRKLFWEKQPGSLQF